MRPSDDAPDGAPSAAGAPDRPPAPPASPDDARVREALTTEYSVLMAAVTAAWTASLTRTSLYLGVVSAAGVAFGFTSQGGMDSGTFTAVAVIVLALTLFLGIATFIRVVEVQRELHVYLMGMNRIRRFFADTSPGVRPYLVLPVHDDEAALYRSIGTGMRRTRPRLPLIHLTVQTQGIVGIVTAVVAGGCVGLAASAAGGAVAWPLALLSFAITLALLYIYWHRSLSEVRRSYPPMFPSSPADPSTG
ncbi:hypothetical protein [Microbacterium immunditiarum]|uniref:Uncharacterized protein n=1 Tax=Microbacterium immunditiarum TaxID=337480 RepID=A0A7Y9GLT7_9MICO|nr:hypothetical protein [Microbacterium immunditiarum]NYE18859.1 hypothetical protein [Microbacterium immunditiarum]